MAGLSQKTLIGPPLLWEGGVDNSHCVDWGYRSTDENDTLAEKWSKLNKLSLVHDAKQPKSFNSKTWRYGYNRAIAIVSDSIVHQVEKCVMEVIPKTQHRPMVIKITESSDQRMSLAEDVQPQKT